mmetsp:Transcript_37412/g.112134  ORF Transcript_37412/g.112134 Transcript_37412/m.112134 type:complete len:196 (+) Transcript_37412:471-1058(+)
METSELINDNLLSFLSVTLFQVGHGMCDGTDPNSGQKINGTLQWLVDNVPSQYGHLQNNGNWTEMTDVWIACNDEDLQPVMHRYGNLRPCHCGGDLNQEGSQVGPELGFGFIVGKKLNRRQGDKVLLLKVACEFLSIIRLSIDSFLLCRLLFTFLLCHRQFFFKGVGRASLLTFAPLGLAKKWGRTTMRHLTLST